MKLTSWILFILFQLPVVFASEGLIYYHGRSNIPRDFQLALNHLQIQERSPKVVLEQIIILDQLLDLVSEEDRLWLPKTELYKALLRGGRGVTLRHEYYERESIGILTQAHRETKNAHNQEFVHFLYGSLLRDLSELMNTTNYQSFILRFKNAPNQLEGDQLVVKRKLDLVLPWVHWYNEGGIELANTKLKPVLMEMLINLNSRLRDFLFLSKTQRISLQLERVGNLTYFEQRPLPPPKTEIATSEKTNQAEAVVEAIIQREGTTLNTPSSEWKPKDDLEDFFNPKPDTNYRPPTTLPEPSNDWLPSPVNDWLDSL